MLTLTVTLQHFLSCESCMTSDFCFLNTSSCSLVSHTRDKFYDSTTTSLTFPLALSVAVTMLVTHIPPDYTDIDHFTDNMKSLSALLCVLSLSGALALTNREMVNLTILLFSQRLVWASVFIVGYLVQR